MKRLTQLALVLLAAFSLSGCIISAVAVAAAGSYYLTKKSDSTSTPSPTAVADSKAVIPNPYPLSSFSHSL